jgi:dipeptidyl aminopeptidase/acylaminoacyl peptidase
MSRIFFSHSSRDDHAALALRQWLASEGWTADSDVFLDIHPDSGLVAGQRWLQALEDAATRCEAVVFLVSEAWLASKWCADEYRLAEKLNKKLFALLIENVALDRLPSGLTTQWQVVRLFGEPVERFQTQHPITSEPGVSYFAIDGLKRFSNGLKKAGIGANTFELQPDPDGPFGWRAPYRGLRALEAEDAAVFFGRDADLVRGIDTLRGLAYQPPPRLLVLLGASGAGKSSYLLAGLLPRLERDDAVWVPLPPVRATRGGAIEGDEGLIVALEQLHKRFGEPVNRADLRLATANGGVFVEHLRAIRAAAGRRSLLDAGTPQPLLVLPIDQAEELFSADAGPSAAQLLNLVRAGMVSGDLLVLATIRTDGYEHLQNAEALEGIHQVTLSLAPVPPGEIGRIIREPAEVLRATAGPQAPVFAAEVVDALQKEMAGEEDALPLLAFALERLMLEHSATPEIGLKELKQTGGVVKAIEAAAEAALLEVGIALDRAAKSAFLRALFIPRLARIDHESKAVQRKVATVDEFADTASRRLLDALVERRLLVKKGAGSAATIEVAHEALLRRWPALVTILHEERDALLVLDGVLHAADDWKIALESRRSELLIHHGQRLAEAEQLLARDDYNQALGESGRTYLAACRKQETERQQKDIRQARQRKRLQTVVNALVLLAAVITAIGGWFVVNGRLELSEQRSDLLASDAELAVNAGYYDSAMRVALIAHQKTDLLSRVSPEAVLILAHAASLSRLDAQLSGHSGPVYSAQFSPDGTRIVTAADDGTARVWREEPDGDWSTVALEGHRDRGSFRVSSAQFSPDGTRIVTASFNTARVWREAPDGGWTAVALEGHEDSVLSAQFSPDGTRIVTTSYDNTARVWREESDGGWVAVALKRHEGAVSSAQFSPDGTRIVIASIEFDERHKRIMRSVRVWREAPDGGWAAVALEEHRGRVYSGQFSPDGTRIVTAFDDNTARMWDRGWSIDAEERAKANLPPLTVAVCKDKLRGTVRITEPPAKQDFNDPLYESVRHLSKSDIGKRPILRGRQGEDVCAPFVNTESTFLDKLIFWR